MDFIQSIMYNSEEHKYSDQFTLHISSDTPE